MPEVTKPGSHFETDSADLGAVAGLPFEIISPQGGSGQFTYIDNQLEYSIQNISGGWIEVSWDNSDTEGIRIPNNEGLTVSVSESCPDSMYAVAAEGGVANVIVRILYLAGK